MKNFSTLIVGAGIALTGISSPALDLKQSKFTQVVNDVQIISGTDKTSKAAALDEIFKVPDVLRTGPNSRAELVAEDQTITRVGANTVFAFDPANRTIALQKGSLLFHSPKGKGGGTIQTGSATASVLGTTIVVTTTPNGGFKLLVLEGEAEVKFLGGLRQHLNAGQMTFVLPGGGLSPIIVFRLDANNKGNQLIHGFERPLPSNNKLGDAILRQTKLILKGKAQDTGLLVGDNATDTQVEAVDANAAQNFFNSHFRNLSQPFQPVRVGDAYRTINGWLVSATDSEVTSLRDVRAAALALSTDISINSSDLAPKHTFASTGPFHITPKDPKCIAVVPNPFTGFLGRNIKINTPHIDMTPYVSVSKFDFLAAKNINITGSVSFDGFIESLGLTAGERILITPGSTLAAQSDALYLKSCGPMRFDRVHLENTPGGINLVSLSDLSLNNSSVNADFDVHLSGHNGVSLDGTQINAAQDVIAIVSDSMAVGSASAILLNHAILNAGFGVLASGFGDVNVNDTAIRASGAYSYISMSSFAGSLSLNGGSVTVANGDSIRRARTLPHFLDLSAGKDVNIAGTTITSSGSLDVTAGQSITINGGATLNAPSIFLTAGDGILLDNVTMTGDRFHATAMNDVHLGNAAHTLDLSGFADVFISGHTLVLQNVNFGGDPVLQSDLGLLANNPNTGQSVQRGYVNFISGVTYLGTLITSANQDTYVNPLTGPGIHISPRAH